MSQLESTAQLEACIFKKVISNNAHVFFAHLILTTGDIWHNQQSVCQPSVQYTLIVYPDLKVSHFALSHCYFLIVPGLLLVYIFINFILCRNFFNTTTHLNL